MDFIYFYLVFFMFPWLRTSSQLTSQAKPSHYLFISLTMVLQYLSVPSNHLHNHTSTCFILHGLGDSGNGWASIAKILSKKLPMTKFILPHASSKPVTLNRGYIMPAWYDIIELNEGARQDKEGILQSVKEILELVAEEENRGIPKDKIVIGGFSQGGAIALSTGLLFKSIQNLPVDSYDFAGIMALGTYLPIKDFFEANKLVIPTKTPIYMCHGTSDQIISLRWGLKSQQYLKKEIGCSDLKFESLEKVGHSIDENAIDSMIKFLQKVFNYEK